MKIAVACDPGTTTLGVFRKGSDLSIWEIVDDRVVSKHQVPQAGGCCGGLAKSVLGVDVVLCNGIGHGAMNHLIEQGTKVVRPTTDPIDVAEAVNQWLSGVKEMFYVASDDCNHSGCHEAHEAHEA